MLSLSNSCQPPSKSVGLRTFIELKETLPIEALVTFKGDSKFIAVDESKTDEFHKPIRKNEGHITIELKELLERHIASDEKLAAEFVAHMLLIKHADLWFNKTKAIEIYHRICVEYFNKFGLSFHAAKDIANKMQLGIIDLQYDFCPAIVDDNGSVLTEQGSLAVPRGNEVFRPLNMFKKFFKMGKTFLTRDSHTYGDITFASTHKVNAFTMMDIDYPEYIEQSGMKPCIKSQKNMLWPDHCIEGTKGCELSHLLELDGNEAVFRKGFGKRESYSAVFDTLGQQSTELPNMLDALDCSIVFVSGLARDYCAGGTAVDLASKKGKIVFMLEDATRSVAEGSDAEMTKKMLSCGVKCIYISDIFTALKAIEPEFSLDLLR